ncbi:MAG: hypothetical protein JWQ09_5230, partial [Segetibacter sp.]|nr:hypothetical protein [Segetibacter sp.]
LVIITNNIERIRITSGGDIMFKNSLTIDKDLTVKGNVNLNTVYGSTVNNGPLTVAKTQPTTLTGTLAVTQGADLKSTLTVAGATNLNSSLKVNNAAATGLTGTLTVDKATLLNNPLTVANASPTNLTGTLSVAQATDLNNSLKVTGPATLNNSLTVANVSATALSGTLAVDRDATFKQKVLVTNSALGSSSASTGALVVNGGVGIGQNLNVGGAANFGGSSSFSGKLLITDATASPNTTTGAAVVTGGVGIGKELNVGGATSLGSSLKVAGAANVAQTLNVTGATALANTLQVTGATSLANTLQVTGATTLQNQLTVNKVATFNDSVILNSSLSSKSLAVSNSVDEFVAVFENNDGSNGDGLKIKLGRTNPMWKGSSYASTPNIAADAFQMPINTIRGWVIDHNPVQPSDLLHLFPHTLVAGTIVNIVNTVTDKINEKLSLPISVGPYGIPAMDVLPRITIIPEICFPEICFGELGCTPAYCTPAVKVGPYGFPATDVIPKFTAIPKIPAIPDVGLPSFSVPNLSFTDVTNSLTNENEFVSFVDKDNRKLGTIRAQSINDFSADYLNGVYFVNLMSSLVGIDVVAGIAGAITEFTNLADAYNNIGVEYSSGHGDYAEWLERVNPEEIISAGDIVAVKGGKISRDLTNAEQVMAVSYRPIIFGNAPEEGQEKAGNKVAFMGQIPVKVVGPVKAGDYIVGRNKIAGYGVAVQPSKISLIDYKFVVGRAWETNLNEGAKLVNTLVGTHNKPILDVLSSNEEKVNKLDSRLNSLEAKADLYLNNLWLKKHQKQKLIK